MAVASSASRAQIASKPPTQASQPETRARPAPPLSQIESSGRTSVKEAEPDRPVLDDPADREGETLERHDHGHRHRSEPGAGDRSRPSGIR